jgi:hypothetical protein
MDYGVKWTLPQPSWIMNMNNYVTSSVLIMYICTYICICSVLIYAEFNSELK